MPKSKTEIVLSETPLEGAEEGTVVITSVFYAKGGINYFTYETEKRGYWVRVAVEKHEKRDGFTIRSFELFQGGMKMFIEEAKAFSAKRLQAIADLYEAPGEPRAKVVDLTSKVLISRAERLEKRAAEREAMRR